MANIIKLKQSAVSGKQPTTAQLDAAELAVNTYDGKLYFKKNVGGTETMLTLVGQNILGSGSPMWTTDTNLMWTQ